MLGDEEACILYKSVGRNIRLHSKGNMVIMTMKTVALEENVSDAHVLGELGFARHEDSGVITHLRKTGRNKQHGPLDQKRASRCEDRGPER